jgi:hypothetical protein
MILKTFPIVRIFAIHLTTTANTTFGVKFYLFFLVYSIFLFKLNSCKPFLSIESPSWSSSSNIHHNEQQRFLSSSNLERNHRLNNNINYAKRWLLLNYLLDEAMKRVNEHAADDYPTAAVVGDDESDVDPSNNYYRFNNEQQLAMRADKRNFMRESPFHLIDKKSASAAPDYEAFVKNLKSIQNKKQLYHQLRLLQSQLRQLKGQMENEKDLEKLNDLQRIIFSFGR